MPRMFPSASLVFLEFLQSKYKEGIYMVADEKDTGRKGPNRGSMRASATTSTAESTLATRSGNTNRSWRDLFEEVCGDLEWRYDFDPIKAE